MRITWILLSLLGIMSRASGSPDKEDGSKCPNVSCSPPLPGAQCTAKYERDDGCCPVWYCTSNGATSTIYGKTTGGSSSSSSSSFSSSSSSSGGGFPGGFQIQLPNLANLFG